LREKAIKRSRKAQAEALSSAAAELVEKLARAGVSTGHIVFTDPSGNRSLVFVAIDDKAAADAGRLLSLTSDHTERRTIADRPPSGP